jgi:hypothetical protein
MGKRGLRGRQPNSLNKRMDPFTDQRHSSLPRNKGVDLSRLWTENMIGPFLPIGLAEPRKRVYWQYLALFNESCPRVHDPHVRGTLDRMS